MGLHRKRKFILGLVISLLIVSLYENWNLEQITHNYSIYGKRNFIYGVGYVQQAYNMIQQGNINRAKLSAYEGIGYIQSTVESMDQSGVRGVFGLSTFINVCMYSLLGYSNRGTMVDEKTKQHYRTVVLVFIDSFKPLEGLALDSITNRQLQQAINRVYHSMTPQERQEYQT